MKSIKIKNFVSAFTQEQIDSMSPESKKVVGMLYNRRHRLLTPKFRAKDMTRTRSWVILRRNLKTGVIEGEVELSFNMGWSSTEARVYRPYLDARFRCDSEFTKAEYNKACSEYVAAFNNRINVYRLKYKDTHEVFISRIGTKTCPIKINWQAFYSIESPNNYQWRNLKFKLRESKK